jgi:hypothetical protein
LLENDYISFEKNMIMPGNEIEVPKELRQFMLDDAEETSLGQKNGAIKQYRYGNLHIREYKDKFLVHTDRFDPRKDPIKHLVFDAPEVLVGITCAVIAERSSKKIVGDNVKLKNQTTAVRLLTSLAFGYTGYVLTKKIKKIIGD